MNTERCTVAIVGYGPAGAALANLLLQQGIDVAVVEPHQHVYPTPRAGGLAPESMRLLQTIGLADELVTGMNTNWTFWYDIFDHDWNKVVERTPDMGPTLQGWTHMATFMQPEFERRVRAENVRLGVHEHLGVRVVDIQHDPEAGVALTLRGPDPADDRVLHADWVIGCDGANSTVRNHIGDGQQEDFGGDQQWLLVHLRVTDKDVELPDRIFKWANRERGASFIPGLPQDIALFEFRVLPGETKEELTDTAKVWELLSPWLEEGQAELLRVTVYEFHTRVAHQWRDGRLMIAGDAAHVMPPELGEGLNSGLRDVMNLAWKLGGVINGQFDESLLDTYTVERRPHVRVYTVMSHEIAQAVAAVADDPDTYRTTLALDAVFRHPWPRLGHGLHQEDAPIPAGMVSEQPVLENGARFDDHVGYRFAVLADEELLAQADVANDRLWRALDAVAVPASTASAREWLERLGHRAVVVRPDRYILGTADTVEELQQLASGVGRFLKQSVAAPSA
jgi:3-(3-hydroxy-phenyl)propionate hydroxylase